MRLSVLYYFGLDGLGSLDWESEQDEDVCTSQEPHSNSNISFRV
jgi:hypothetical protein